MSGTELRPHSIPLAEFDEIARGGGSSASLATLRLAQLSKHLLALWTLVREASVAYPTGRVAASTVESFALMAAVRRTAPDAWERVLLYPTVGAWVFHCLRKLRRTPSTSTDVEADIAQIGAVAAGMAVHGGIGFDVAVLVRGGRLVVPSVGVLLNPTATGQMWVRLRGGGNSGFKVVWPSGEQTVTTVEETRTWQPTRRLSAKRGPKAGPALDVAFEDNDDYRSCGAYPAAPRCDAVQAGEWQAVLDHAWTRLTERHANRVHSVAIMITAIVPMARIQGGAAANATSADAPGGVATTEPTNAGQFALTLVHEAQHLKLSALMDVVPLCEGPRHARFYAPWRADARPIGGLLHGAYAFLGVAGFWREEMLAVAPGRRFREAFEFAFARDSVRRVLDTLEASGFLTVAGCRFVLKMREEIESWQATPLPSPAEQHAREMAADTRRLWRLRNCRPEPVEVEVWTGRYLAGQPRPADPPSVTVVRAHAGIPVRHSRLVVTVDIRTRRVGAGEPARVEHASVGGSTALGDIHYAHGQAARARECYRERLLDDPLDLDAFSGLLLVDERGHDPDDYPELCYAMWRRLVAIGGAPVDPLDVAAWVAAP